MSFSNPIVAGVDLVREAIRSPNFVAGVSGWRIARDGSAEFNNVVVRGTLAVGTITGDLVMQPGGRIMTAPAPGARTELAYDQGNRIEFYTGMAAETAPPAIYSGGDDFSNLQSLVLTSGTRSGDLSGSTISVTSWPGASPAFLNEVTVTAARIHLQSRDAAILLNTVNLFTTQTAVQLNTGVNPAVVQIDATGRLKAARHGNDMAQIQANVETFQCLGSGAGYRLAERDNSVKQWVMYANGNYLRLWDGGDKFQLGRDNGRLYLGMQANGQTAMGPWAANDGYTFFGNAYQISNSVSNYAILQGHPGVDNRTFLNAPTNGDIVIRRANTGQALDLKLNGLPSLGGGNTLNYQAGGSEQVGYVLSRRDHKQDIRPLPETGPLNPIWGMEPVRFRWRDNVLNADEINSLHPDGIAGFIADDLMWAAPDACTYFGQAEVGGVDTLPMLAYLVDAVHWLRGRLDAHETDESRHTGRAA